MNVLILGGGGREHALSWKISQSPLLNQLYIAPGNAGTHHTGKNITINVNDFKEVANVAKTHAIDMIVVGPEAPLVAGIRDYFAQDPELQHIHLIAPSKEAAKLEGSKDFAKAFMNRHAIPTASYLSVTLENMQEGLDFLEKQHPPYVLKADGLAGGKGVLILEEKKQARQELQQMLEGKFGQASSRVVLETFLEGIELSVFVLTDGKDYLLLPEAKDYKRIGEHDTGLNTGGMGAVSPVPFADNTFMKRVKERIIAPTIKGIQQEKLDYKGFLFFGLMNVNGAPYVIEYNCRMGDPEAEAIIPRINQDLLELLQHVSRGELQNKSVEITPKTAASVMMVSGGYPGSYEKGFALKGIKEIQHALLFHAGTKIAKNKTVTNGGRVIAVTALAPDLPQALELAYADARKIIFNKAYYRHDIGFDL